MFATMQWCEKCGIRWTTLGNRNTRVIMKKMVRWWSWRKQNEKEIYFFQFISLWCLRIFHQHDINKLPISPGLKNRIGVSFLSLFWLGTFSPCLCRPIVLELRHYSLFVAELQSLSWTPPWRKNTVGVSTFRSFTFLILLLFSSDPFRIKC